MCTSDRQSNMTGIYTHWMNGLLLATPKSVSVQNAASLFAFTASRSDDVSTADVMSTGSVQLLQTSEG
ncbi:hypothetical protein F2P81_006077 [Scophthalmus maximus]|uniref:Uncharacterized protein n=1 Tax=Scophthalmus maximus TaxID=52904 RepID=A0A6A4TBE9_SCOMX|nr:hypothetical protein F2P81_006077 [Scophthalmus maximus]